mmetsp:Transcript_3466/g.12593  ORF Transcript_3466/g.12593 Transcript_3466/m.12593 type:complete len:352 (+) Transcript_3466:698-1753(+)
MASGVYPAGIPYPKAACGGADSVGAGTCDCQWCAHGAAADATAADGPALGAPEGDGGPPAAPAEAGSHAYCIPDNLNTARLTATRSSGRPTALDGVSIWSLSPARAGSRASTASAATAAMGAAPCGAGSPLPPSQNDGASEGAAAANLAVAGATPAATLLPMTARDGPDGKLPWGPIWPHPAGIFVAAPAAAMSSCELGVCGPSDIGKSGSLARSASLIASTATVLFAADCTAASGAGNPPPSPPSAAIAARDADVTIVVSDSPADAPSAIAHRAEAPDGRSPWHKVDLRRVATDGARSPPPRTQQRCGARSPDDDPNLHSRRPPPLSGAAACAPGAHVPRKCRAARAVTV